MIVRSVFASPRVRELLWGFLEVCQRTFALLWTANALNASRHADLILVFWISALAASVHWIWADTMRWRRLNVRELLEAA